MSERIKNFISPARSEKLWIRLLPYLTLAAAGFLIVTLTGASWEYTNSSEFCGEGCHTMPPQYVSHQASSHARVNCVECHIGRGLIATQFTRKAGDISHVVKLLGAEYEVPIYVKHLRPANQICERCHSPEKFSGDALREIKRYDAENNNEESLTYLSFKVGGGTEREGLGKGIHWHIENPVEYIATDDPHLQQEIPWVRVTNSDGITTEYVDVETNLPEDFVEQNEEHIQTVDCMTCHNRNAHPFPSPSNAMDDAMARGVISPNIPYFKKNAVAVMDRVYPSNDEALAAIDGLKDYYAENWASYYAENSFTVDAAVNEVSEMYQQMVFPDMAVNWDTHPDNVGHLNSPGCFRCHDGKHLSEDNEESIRIECNLCHSIPLKSRPDGTTAFLPVTEPFEPESHIDSNWVSRHRFEFDSTCEGCHDVSNPGGSDDSSYCANSGCHATEWKYAGLNAPGIIELTNVLHESLPTYPEANLTWDDLVGPILEARCVSCHGGTAGLYLDSYDGVLAGGNLGPAIIPGNAEESLLIQLQREGHPNSLAPRELEWIAQWINEGAPEN